MSVHEKAIFNQGCERRSNHRCAWAFRLLRSLTTGIVILALLCCGRSRADEAVEVRDSGKVMLKLSRIKTLHFDSFVTSFAWSPDGDLFATSENWDRTIKVWNARTWELKKVLLNSKNWRGSDKVLFSSDGKYVITSSPEIGSGKSREALIAIDIASGQIAHRLEGPNEISGPSGWPLANKPVDGHLILSPGRDRLYVQFPSKLPNPDLCAYDMRTWTRIDCWVSKRGVNAILTGPDRDQLITSNAFGQVQIWDFPTRQVIRGFQATSATLNALGLDPTGQLLATGEGSRGSRLDEKSNKWIYYGEEDAIRLWDTKTGKLVRSVASPPDVNDIMFSPSGRYLVADARVRPTHSFAVYRVSDLKELATVGDFEHSLHVDFSRDGRFLAACGDDHISIYVFDETGVN